MEPNTHTPNGAFTIFHFFGLLMALGAIVCSIQAGWETGGAVGALLGVATAVVLAPIGLAVGFAGSLATLLLIVFVGDHKPPPGAWAGRAHKAARMLVVMACLVSLVYNVPRLLEAPTWRAWRDETKLGVFLPICMLIFLQISRFEERAKPRGEGR